MRLSAERGSLATSDSIGVKYGQKVDMSNEIERFELGFIIGAGVNIGRRFVIDRAFVPGPDERGHQHGGRREDPRIRGFSIMAGGRF